MTDRSVPVDLVLRPMEADEASAAVSVLMTARDAATEAGLVPPPVHPRADADRWFTEEVVPHRDVWVAERGGRVIATMVLDADFLDQLSVLPAHAGQGVGSSLLELAMALRPEGFGLWVFATNRRARALYEAHGLVPVEYGDGSGNIEGAPDVRYVWRPSRDVADAE